MACKHCGYELDLHSFLSLRCPADDPNEQKELHLFSESATYEEGYVEESQPNT